MGTITPYEGSEPYIFISYSHKDDNVVLPVIEELFTRGYRVWYDDGVIPAANWDDVIAKHIKACSIIFAFVSVNYINSENCLNELEYARKNKKRPLLIYLEETDLPDGMEMNFSRYQALYKYKLTEEQFWDKISRTENIDKCKPIPKLNIRAKQQSDESLTETDVKYPWPPKNPSTKKKIKINLPEDDQKTKEIPQKKVIKLDPSTIGKNKDKKIIKFNAQDLNQRRVPSGVSVYISNAPQDNDIRNKLTNALKSRGIYVHPQNVMNYYLDPRTTRNNLIDESAKRGCVICIVSENTENDSNVITDITEAQSKNAMLFSILVDEVPFKFQVLLTVIDTTEYQLAPPMSDSQIDNIVKDIEKELLKRYPA